MCGFEISPVPSNGARGGETSSNVHPETHSKDVREDERRQENFEEFCREDSSFLHHTGVPHAESAGTLRVPQQKLLGRQVFRATRPVPDPVCIFLHQGLHLSPPLHIVFL